MISIRPLPYLHSAVGAACAALSLELCYIPHGLMDGGVAGAAVLLGRAIHVPPVFLLIPLNAACLSLGIRRLGRNYIATSTVSLLVYGTILRLLGPFPPLMPLPLAVILGGAGIGLGVGLLLRAGGALDGCETLGLLVQDRLGIPAALAVAMANFAVFTLAVWRQGVQSTLPSLAAQALGQVVMVWVAQRRTYG